MKIRFAAAFALVGLFAGPAVAQFVDADHQALRERAIRVLEGQFGAFQAAAHRLADAAPGYCQGAVSDDAFAQVFRQTWLAWAPLDAYQFGPIEQRGAVLTVGFWPDKKDFVGRGLKAVLALPPEQLADPDVIATQSAAVQGLPAIERLLFSDLPACPAVVGISGYLKATADTLYDDWFGAQGWAELARAAGPDNPVYLSAEEFTKVLYTAMDFELTRIADARLGRPLGTFDRPMPKRAEAWRSGLSLEIVDAQLAGISDMLERAFAAGIYNPSLVWVRGVLADARDRVAGIGAPLDQAVSDPSIRIRVEGLQSKIIYLQSQFAQDIGPDLGVDTGFSAADGD